MATLSITIPNAVATRVQDSFCAAHGYQATLPDGSANPETKQQFLKRKVVEFIRDSVKAAEATAAAETARQAALTDVDTTVVLS